MLTCGSQDVVEQMRCSSPPGPTKLKTSEECDLLGRCLQKVQVSSNSSGYWRESLFDQLESSPRLPFFDPEQAEPAFVAFLLPDPARSLMVLFSALELVCSSFDLLSGRVCQTLLQAWRAEMM